MSEGRKSSRYARKAEKRKLKNHSVSVFCNNGHFMEGFTLNRVHSEHPELRAVANTTICLQKPTTGCETCEGAGTAAKQKEAARIRFLFRANDEQNTRVTLHNVRYILPSGDIASASFQGKVMKVSIDPVTCRGFIGIVLHPRKDISFADTLAFGDDNVRVEKDALFMRKDAKGIAFVHVFPMHLARDSPVVRLGIKCTPEKCDNAGEECVDHKLRS